MLIAIITDIKALISIEPGSSSDLQTSRPEDRGLYMIGDGTADGPEKGRAIVQVEWVLNEDIAAIEDIFFLNGLSVKAKLIGRSDPSAENGMLDLYFDDLFANGFENSAEDLLATGMVLVGFPAGQFPLKDPETQQTLFHHLVDLLLPDKKEQVKNLLLNSVVLHVADNDTPARSYFAGHPGIAPPVDKKGRPMLHLATIHTKDIKELGVNWPDFGDFSNLSFYLDIEDTEDSWPEEAGRFQVIGHHNQPLISPTNAGDEPAVAIVPAVRLELPGYNHSALHVLDFTDEEQEKYEAIEQLFLTVSGREDRENNKFLGYPDAVQYCVAYEAERIKTGSDYADDIYQDAVAWQLLLQVSPYEHKFRFFEKFGDGTIYFMILKKDLQAGNFENVQVVVQNT